MQRPVTVEMLPESSSLTTDVLFEGGRSFSGLLQYAVKRFTKPDAWMGDEKGQLRYEVEPSYPAKNNLELRFCLLGNAYCKNLRNDCNQCKAHLSESCDAKVESVDFVSVSFSPDLLQQFVKSRTATDGLSEKVLSFQYPSSFTRTVTLCGKTRLLLEGLLNHTYAGSLENIFVTAQSQLLLLNTLDCMDDKELGVLNCKFLSNEADREKVFKARDILVQQIGEPITIKQLSRKVAMNECYLKKGFKEMFGTTIFEFYQGQRMEHAKYLLYEKGLSVTEVSDILGYSSISHFSTAFKKQTGLKPCELLLRQ